VLVLVLVLEVRYPSLILNREKSTMTLPSSWNRHTAAITLLFLAAALAFPAVDGAAQKGDVSVAKFVPRMKAASPAKAPVPPATTRRILVFSVTNGFRHGAIPYGLKAIDLLGKTSGAYEAVISNDVDHFRPENLARFDAVCFLNTTGPVFASQASLDARRLLADAARKRREIESLTPLVGRDVKGKDLARLRRHLGAKRMPGRMTAGEIMTLREAVKREKERARKAKSALAEASKDGREAALERSLLEFIRGGGGFVGIHAATDTLKDWPEYLEMIGGVFAGHPWTADKTVAIKLDEPSHPLNAAFGGKGFTVKDEIYQIKGPYSRDKLRVLLSLDVADGKERVSGIPGSRADHDYAVSWIRRYGRGRVFYCSLGHNPEIYWNRAILGHYLAGIQFALGDLEADARPSSRPEAAGDRLVSSPADYAIDPFMGVYPGLFTPDRGKPLPIEAQVIADGGGKYRVVLTALPDGPPFRIALAGETHRGEVLVSGRDAGADWKGRIVDRRITVRAESENGGAFAGARVERCSPTLGASPPPGAVVLHGFGGKPPSLEAWTNSTWKALPDGSMGVGKGNNVTRRKFGDVKLHLECRTPYEPTRRGQKRGNSGVYVMDRYEVQVLDSFGLVSRPNDCGAVYAVAAPRVNACLPPLRWQTYDIVFRAARFGPDGKSVVKQPTITVRHNGRLIHENAPVPRTTPGGGGSNLGHGKTGPLMLQDHSNPLRFRNIWAVELKDEGSRTRR